MSTLREIAASFGIRPLELVVVVGMNSRDLDVNLEAEQTAAIVNFLDRTDFFGPSTTGRHDLRKLITQPPNTQEDPLSRGYPPDPSMGRREGNVMPRRYVSTPRGRIFQRP